MIGIGILILICLYIHERFEDKRTSKLKEEKDKENAELSKQFYAAIERKRNGY